MNLDELKTLWASPENRPTPERMREFIDSALKAIQSERRRAKGMLIYVGFMVSATSIFSVWQLLVHGIGPEARYAHLMLLTLWVAAIAMARNMLSRIKAEPIDSIQATIKSLHRRAQTRCRELQTLLLLFATFIPLTALAIFQLQASGKMRPHEAASAAILAGLILFSGSGWFLFELLVRKNPERLHLESLLKEYRL